MSTTTASRLPLSRLPAKSGKITNGTLTQKTPATASTKLQKGSMIKTKLKPPSAGINKSPNNTNNTTTLQTTNGDNTQTNSSVTTVKRTTIKTNIDSKTSSVRSLLPSPKSSTTSSSIMNDLKNPIKKNITAKQTSPLRRKSEDTPGRNSRVAPSLDSQKFEVKTITKTILRKKATPVQQQPTATKKPISSTRKFESNSKLLSEIEKLRAENKKLQAEKKELMQEKGLLTVDVCQMEHRLACEESRVLELEVDVADLRKQCNILNGKHDQLDRSQNHYRSELDIANKLIMEQAVTMSDQQVLIEELMNQLDEQEHICQNLQSVVDSFKTKNSVFDNFKEVSFAWQVY